MKGFLELDTHFDKFQERLTPCGRDLYRLPDFAEVSLNLLSMANFLPLLAPVLDAVSPRRICEIGAYRGISTRAFADLVGKYGGELLVVDPAIDPATADVRADNIKYFQMLSEEFLSTPRHADVIFIDGDHNYEVVSTELQLVADTQFNPRYPILLMHDTGWPCAHRDMYYDVSRIHHKHELSPDRVLRLTNEEFAELEISMRPGVDFAVREGGPGNGVKPAIDDFLASHPGWRQAHLPSLYGVGVLWYEEHVSATVAQELEKLAQLFERISSFSAVLEFNRVMLLSEINRQGEVWKQDQQYISDANEKITTTLKGLSEAREEVIATQGEATAERQKVTELQRAFEHQLSEARANLAFAEDRIAAINAHNSGLSERVTYLETGKGAFKQLVNRIITRIKRIF